MVYLRMLLPENISPLLSPFLTLKEVEFKSFYMKEGDNLDKIAVISKGVFCISFTNIKGNEYVKYFLSEGDFLAGNLSNHRENNVSIQAIETSAIYEMSYSQFLKLCEQNRELEQYMFSVVQRYWGIKEKRLIDLLSYDAAENYEEFKKEYAHLIERIPLHYQAKYLGVSATQLSRIRAKC